VLFFRGRVDPESRYSDPDRLRELIGGDEPHQLVDVRTVGEFQTGHIPTARLIPYREIADEPPTPDKEMLIILYCAGGARSRKAARRLTAKGYRNIVNFGGINRWNGSLEYGPAAAES
jgi:rhodanese-related sulfurtransferase